MSAMSAPASQSPKSIHCTGAGQNLPRQAMAFVLKQNHKDSETAKNTHSDKFELAAGWLAVSGTVNGSLASLHPADSMKCSGGSFGFGVEDNSPVHHETMLLLLLMLIKVSLQSQTYLSAFSTCPI